MNDDDDYLAHLQQVIADHPYTLIHLDSLTPPEQAEWVQSVYSLIDVFGGDRPSLADAVADADRLAGLLGRPLIVQVPDLDPEGTARLCRHVSDAAWTLTRPRR